MEDLRRQEHLVLQIEVKIGVVVEAVELRVMRIRKGVSMLLLVVVRSGLLWLMLMLLLRVRRIMITRLYRWLMMV